MSKTRIARCGVLAWICLGCALLPAASKYRRQGTKRIERALQYLDEIAEAPDTAIPVSVFQNCRGIIIVRQYKAGFIFGAKGGVGLAMLKDRRSKRWSAPVFIKTGEGSFGFQIGGQSIDTICLIMNKEGVEMLLKSKFKIGVDASAAVGPVGRDAAAKVGPGTALLVYARAKGLYVGAAFEGGLLLLDGKVNKAFYGADSNVEAILEGRVPMPDEAKPLARALARYAGEQPSAAPAGKSARGPRREQAAGAPRTAAAKNPDAARGGDRPSDPAAAKPGPQTPGKQAKQQPGEQDRKLLEELSRLRRMHKKGLITDNEYHDFKRKLLEKHF